MVAKSKAVSKKASKKSEKVSPLAMRLGELRRNRRFVVAMVVLILLSLGYLGKSLLFAAVVGVRPITRYEVVRELERGAGKETLDRLVTQQLIEQEAGKKGINISDADIQKELERINGLVEAQGTTLDAALALQGQTKESFKEFIKVQKTLEEILKEEIAVSDEELKKYFEENKSFYGEEAKYEDLKENLSEQLKQEKLANEFKTWIEKLKSDTKILYFVNY